MKNFKEWLEEQDLNEASRTIASKLDDVDLMLAYIYAWGGAEAIGKYGESGNPKAKRLSQALYDRFDDKYDCYKMHTELVNKYGEFEDEVNADESFRKVVPENMQSTRIGIYKTAQVAYKKFEHWLRANFKDVLNRHKR